MPLRTSGPASCGDCKCKEEDVDIPQSLDAAFAIDTVSAGVTPDTIDCPDEDLTIVTGPTVCDPPGTDLCEPCSSLSCSPPPGSQFVDGGSYEIKNDNNILNLINSMSPLSFAFDDLVIQQNPETNVACKYVYTYKIDNTAATCDGNLDSAVIGPLYSAEEWKDRIGLEASFCDRGNDCPECVIVRDGPEDFTYLTIVYGNIFLQADLTITLQSDRCKKNWDYEVVLSIEAFFEHTDNMNPCELDSILQMTFTAQGSVQATDPQIAADAALAATLNSMDSGSGKKYGDGHCSLTFWVTGCEPDATECNGFWRGCNPTGWNSELDNSDDEHYAWDGGEATLSAA